MKLSPDIKDCIEDTHASGAYPRGRLAAAVPRYTEPQTLLNGFSMFLSYLLDAEADYLCGVPKYARLASRVNSRIGYRYRKIVTPAGVFPVGIPMLKFIHPRVSIAKRAQRLAPRILEILACMRSDGVSLSGAASLIKMAWTCELPDDLLTTLLAQLVPLLQKWRDGLPCELCMEGAGIRKNKIHGTLLATDTPRAAELHSRHGARRSPRDPFELVIPVS